MAEPSLPFETERGAFNVRINVEAGGRGAFVHHLMMDPPTLHGGFFTSALLVVHGLRKLYKKCILP